MTRLARAGVTAQASGLLLDLREEGRHGLDRAAWWLGVGRGRRRQDRVRLSGRHALLDVPLRPRLLGALRLECDIEVLE